ncbi:MAG: VacB/RNase II family 3'-5' exoribonuclease, partial [Rhodospirillales bacterium]|nr:VacB/RNase II family 3'-5' exoribonuclease [Rhodospirillales bacterium]
EDLRNIPLITIDGADSRDFDDAVWAEPDTTPDNNGGWHLIVAIADVAWYVRPNSALDKDAYQRGNSVYFPDRVVPMLPEALSNGWCSLVPKEDRPCMAAHLWLNAEGNLIRHRFCRAMMRSHARLTYEQVQGAHDGVIEDATEMLVEKAISPLYGAYKCLAKARSKRGALELDLPERQVIIAEDGSVQGVTVRQRHDSHKLIEEFMIAANVAAAETLEKFKQPCMYRIHNQPSLEKMEALREFLNSMEISIPKGQVIRAQQFNKILERVAGTTQSEIINTVILRSQSQAEYSPDNIGHFGLNLHKYSHFTSPIRRYSDLLVHRALILGLRLDKALSQGGLDSDILDFTEVGTHLSQCERRAATAERDAVDRFIAGFMAGNIGDEFIGRVNGVTRFGLFIKLVESGAEGLMPISSLPNDYYVHDEVHQCLRGDRNGRVFTLGQNLNVTLVEAIPLTGGMILRLSDHEPGPERKNRAVKRGNGKRNSKHQKKQHKARARKAGMKKTVKK